MHVGHEDIRCFLFQNSPENHPEKYWEKKGLAKNSEHKDLSFRAREFLLRALYSQEISHIRKYVAPGKRILELGCSNGDLLSILKDCGYHVTGLEPDPVSFSVGRSRHPNLDLVNTVVETADFAPKSFDAVIMIHVFEHVATPNEALQEINRILKDDGNSSIKNMFDASGFAEIKSYLSRMIPASLSDIENPFSQ